VAPDGDQDWTRIEEVPALVARLYDLVDEFEQISFRGANTTPDGHLLGSLGESLAAYMFGLRLNTASTTAHDAFTKDEVRVEIKATQINRVSLRFGKAFARGASSSSPPEPSGAARDRLQRPGGYCLGGCRTASEERAADHHIEVAPASQCTGPRIRPAPGGARLQSDAVEVAARLLVEVADLRPPTRRAVSGSPSHPTS
jgi:hypothetical protein